jgi:hypothetical protein
MSWLPGYAAIGLERRHVRYKAATNIAPFHPSEHPVDFPYSDYLTIRHDLVANAIVQHFLPFSYTTARRSSDRPRSVDRRRLAANWCIDQYASDSTPGIRSRQKTAHAAALLFSSGNITSIVIFPGV